MNDLIKNRRMSNKQQKQLKFRCNHPRIIKSKKMYYIKNNNVQNYHKGRHYYGSCSIFKSTNCLVQQLILLLTLLLLYCDGGMLCTTTAYQPSLSSSTLFRPITNNNNNNNNKLKVTQDDISQFPPLWTMICTTITTPTTLLQQQQQQQKHPSMFLDGLHLSSKIHLSSSITTPKRFITEKSKNIYKTDSIPTRYYKNKVTTNRGILGFDITSDDSSRSSTTTTTQLYSTRVSGVDSSAWNLPQDIMEQQQQYGDIILSQEKLLSIQWIANDEEIDSLTVVQLKEELGVRGLKKTGNKYELQQRLKEWTAEQRKISDRNSSSLSSSLDFEALFQQQPQMLTANPLAEWARNLDLEPLLQKRKQIHKEKMNGKKRDNNKIKPKHKKQLPEDYRAILQKVYEKPSSKFSNKDVQKMYEASKHADQIGDYELSQKLLYELKIATPNDARVYRRLARLKKEQGQIESARQILHEGLHHNPDNAYILHGLGQLANTTSLQKMYYKKAIQADPTIPNSYHALGTLEHTQGNIASAMKILKNGLEYCPKNHRLHHALGDIYRDAKLLNHAEICYKKALELCPTQISYGFCYIALAYIAYEQGHIDTCRRYLQKTIQDNVKQANALVSLVQLEESLNNINEARSICMDGITKYEQLLLLQQSKYRHKQQQQNKKRKTIVNKNQHDTTIDATTKTTTNDNNIIIPKYRSGDRFYNVYRTLLRLEEKYGTRQSYENVYQRACIAFPYSWKLCIDAAEYYNNKDISKARDLYTEACNRSKRYAEPYRLFAEFEMLRGNYQEARAILYSGAWTITNNEGAKEGTVELFLAWAICEWHLNHLYHAQKLFEYALEVLTDEHDNDTSRSLRAFVLYVMARFEYSGRNEPIRAQHYIGLCLKENSMPLFGNNAKVWELWVTIANDMNDVHLAEQCKKQLLKTLQDDKDDPSALSLSRMLQSKQELVRREPWHYKIFGHYKKNKLSNLYRLLPDYGR